MACSIDEETEPQLNKSRRPLNKKVFVAMEEKAEKGTAIKLTLRSRHFIEVIPMVFKEAQKIDDRIP